MPLNAQIALSIVAHESTVGDISRQMRVTPASYSLMLTDGASAGQAQVVWSDSMTISGATALQPSSLPDTRDGASVTVSFTALKALYIRNTHAAGVLAVAAPAGLLATILYIRPGGSLFLCNPDEGGNTSGVGSVVQHTITPSVSGMTCDIVLIGEGTVT